MATALLPLGAISSALTVSAIIIWWAGVSPVEAYAALFRGAVGTTALLTTTLAKSIPLMLAGLAVTVAYRAALWNVGAEGQLYMGALCAVVIGTRFQLPGWLHLPLALLAGAGGGLVWGAIPGWLKARRGFNEVIVTILMNYIALWLVSALIHGPLKEPGWNIQTAAVAATARLPILWPGSRLHLGLLIALALGLIIWTLLTQTTLGFRIRMVGLNPEAARYAGVDVARITILTMSLSGAVAGLAGASEILGTHYRLIEGFSPGYGFDAIAVALVGRLQPLGTILAALLFGALRNGANTMQTAVGLPVVIIYLIQGLMILFMIVGTTVQERQQARTRHAPGASASP